MSVPSSGGDVRTSILPKVLAVGALVGGLAGAGAGVGVLKFGGPAKPIEAVAPVGGAVVAGPAEPTAGPESAAESGPAEPKVGFRMGTVAPDEAIASIKVTLSVGADGGELNEPIDLHLGVGFPLRLYPLGTDDREPAFAAFPQKSSLERGTNRIQPGEHAVFEFTVQPDDPGADMLRTTPQLLSDLKLGDLRQIGFASPARSGWVLEGYEIEVNGKLFASNDSVATGASQAHAKLQEEMRKLQPEYEQLALQTADLAAYVATGLAGDADKEDLKKKQESLAKSAPPINALAARLAGAAPWFEESNKAFKPAPITGTAVKRVEVTLIAGGGDRPGSRNPVYLWADGLKYLLTSEVDPLADESEPQTFVLSEDDLARSPLTKERLAKIGIGMIGNDQRFSKTPDRAKLERVVVKADGETVFDSETTTGDRQTLAGVWLQPPAHRDESGALVVNSVSPLEPNLWKSGTTLPETELAKSDAVDDAKPEPAPTEPLTELPGGYYPPSSGATAGTEPVTGSSPTGTSGGATDPAAYPGGAADPGAYAGAGEPTSYGTIITTPFGSGGYPFAPPFRRLLDGLGGLGGLTPLVPPIFINTGGSGGGNNGWNRGPGANWNGPPGAWPPGVAGPVAGLPPAGLGNLPGFALPAGGAPPIAGNPAPAAVPAPAVPSITNVQINLNVGSIRDGDTAPVSWQVVGNVGNVTSYRVDLFGVLPHLPQPLLPQPLATLANVPPPTVAAAGGSQSMNAVTPTIKAANAKLNGVALTPAQNTYLYVQPKVTAVSAGGTDLASGFGPLIPLFFAGTPQGSFSLSPGNLLAAVFTTPPSFMRIVGGVNQPWQPYLGFTDPQTTSAVWMPAQGTATHSAQIFAPDFGMFGASPASYNVVARPNGVNGEIVTVVFEGWVQMPSAVAAAGGPALPAGLRAVAHVGFVGGGATAADVARVQSAASVGPYGPFPGPLDNRCFLLSMNAPLILNRTAGGGSSPMLLIDMPLRFDKMAGPNPTVQSDTSYFDAVRYSVTDWNPSVFALGSVRSPASRSSSGAISLVRPPVGSVYVRLTYMIQLTAADPNTAVGIIGVRLVPDASP